MEDWREPQEAIKADINQLKDQVGQILEALAALKSIREVPVARHHEVTFSYPPTTYLGVLQVQNNVT